MPMSMYTHEPVPAIIDLCDKADEIDFDEDALDDDDDNDDEAE